MARLNLGELLKIDFTDGTRQGFTNGSVSGGKLSIGDWDTSVYQQKFANVTYSFTVKITSVTGADTWRSVRPVMLYKDTNNKYMLQISPNENLVVLYRVASGVENYQAQATVTNELNKDYTYTWTTTIVGSSTTHVITRDGVEIINYTDTGNTTLKSGYVGFHNNGATSVVDNILVDTAVQARTTIGRKRQSVQIIPYSLKFDGIDDTVTNLTPAVLPTTATPLTISTWFRSGKPAVDAANSQPLVTWGYYRFYIRAFAIQSRLRIRQDSTTAKECIQQGTLSPEQNWHHAVATVSYNGGTNTTMKVYIDGILTATANQSVLPVTHYGYNIGSNVGNFQGNITDTRIWHEALSQAQVEDLYYRGTNSIAPLLWLKFSEGSGTSPVNYGTGTFSPTITGATYSTDTPLKQRVASSTRTNV